MRNIQIFFICVISFFLFIPFASFALVTQDNLVKCPEFSSVYYLAQDGKRYVFPNDRIYFSWYPDFSQVKSITCEELATLPIGGVVFYQPSTKLIKLHTDPKVYYVQRDGILRPIESESQAIRLFGSEWAKRVDDLPESFFVQYSVGTAIQEGEIPDDLILTDDNETIYKYIDQIAIDVTDQLSERQIAIRRQFARRLQDIRQQFSRDISVLNRDDVQREHMLERAMTDTKTIFVDEQRRQLISPFRELTQTRDESREALQRAQREIQQAQTRMKGFSQAFTQKAQAALEQAQELLQKAQEAFKAMRYISAEEFAKMSQGKAARIKEEHLQEALSFDQENNDQDDILLQANTEDQEEKLGAIVMDEITGIKYMKSGYASWYKYKGCDCAASPDFPKGSLIEVTAWNGNSVIVTINDWGPEREVFDQPRPIDLDYEAFRKLAKPSLGLVRVEVKPISIPLH